MKFFKVILVFSLFLVKCFAYGGNGGGGISLAAPQSTGGSVGYDASGTNGISLGGSGSGDIAGPISLSGPSRSAGGSYSGNGGVGLGSSGGRYQAAIFTKHSVETRPVMTSNELIQPSIIEVDGGDIPLELIFKSTTSRLKVRQQHSSGSASPIQETNSEEPGVFLRHTVRKPIIQEVREIITPMRRIVQEIYPVQEVIETIVARAQSQLSGNRGQDGGGGAPQIRSGGNGAISLGGSSGFGDLSSRGFAGEQGSVSGAGAGIGVGVGTGAGASTSGNGAGAYNTASGNSLSGNSGLSLPVNINLSTSSAGTKGGY